MIWTPDDVITERIGRIHVIVNDIDVTLFRDIPTIVSSWSSSDPFGDSTAVITFPQITPFDAPGFGDLDWLIEWANVDLVLEEPDGTKTTLWEGMIATFEDTTDEQSIGLDAMCIGALHQVDLYVRAPQYYPNGIRNKLLVQQQFLHGTRPHLRTAPLEIEDPGNNLDDFTTRLTGSWDRVLTGYLQDLLAEMIHQTDFLKQWTIQHKYPRTPILRYKTMPTESFWTLSVGAPGVSVQLSKDHQQTPNVFYGEGSDEAGTNWANSYIDENDRIRFHPLAYDTKVHRHPDRPSEHSDFDDTLIRVETHNTYGQGVSNAEGIDTAEQLLRRNRDPGWTGSLTLKSDPEEGSRYKIRADDNILLKWYRQRPHPGSGYYFGISIGTIDGYAATWRNEDGEVWIDKDGTMEHIGYMFHIAAAEIDIEGTMTLTVDTKFRDLLTIAELLERKREGSTDPVSRLSINRKSREVTDDKVEWDYQAGSGYIPTAFINATDFGDPSPNTDSSFYVFVEGSAEDFRDQWTVVPIRTSTKGQIRRTEIRAFNPDGTAHAIKFSCAIFSRKMISDDMPRDPFHADAWHTGSGIHEGKDPLLRQPPDMIIGWGQGDQGAGFWPGLETNGDPASGILIDEGSWEYQLDREVEGRMWVALYAEVDTYFQGRLIHGVSSR